MNSFVLFDYFTFHQRLQQTDQFLLVWYCRNLIVKTYLHRLSSNDVHQFGRGVAWQQAGYFIHQPLEVWLQPFLNVPLCEEQSVVFHSTGQFINFVGCHLRLLWPSVNAQDHLLCSQCCHALWGYFVVLYFHTVCFVSH